MAPMDRDIAIAKLKALAAGAALARERYAKAAKTTKKPERGKAR
jgi:hypothetical protein